MLSGDAGADLNLQQLLFVQLLRAHADSADSGESLGDGGLAVTHPGSDSVTLVSRVPERWMADAQALRWTDLLSR